MSHLPSINLHLGEEGVHQGHLLTMQSQGHLLLLPPTYFNNLIHQVEIAEESDEESRECVHLEVSVAKIVKIQAPITCKAVTRPIKERRNNPPSTQGSVPYKQKHKSYSFYLSKSKSIFDELLRNKVIKFDDKHVFPKQEEVKGKVYCKWHSSFSHAMNNCMHFRDII